MNQQNKKIKTRATTKKHYVKSQSIKLYMTFGLNNTIITVTTLTGRKLFQLTPPCIGFKGPKKPTAYAAHKTMEEVMRRVQENHKATTIHSVIVSGPGPGRDVALRTIKMPVGEVTDVTPVVYNGCRPPAMRSKG
jgi:small subunit ribosomal protein S11